MIMMMLQMVFGSFSETFCSDSKSVFSHDNSQQPLSNNDLNIEVETVKAPLTATTNTIVIIVIINICSTISCRLLLLLLLLLIVAITTTSLFTENT